MKNVLNKLFKIQQELKVPKNQRNTFGNYNFRSCEDIMEASKPICSKYNCLITCSDEITVFGEHDPHLYEEKYYDKDLKKENMRTSSVGQQRFYVKATATLYDLDSEETISTVAYAREEETKKGMDQSQITGASSSYARKYALNGLLQLDDNKDADTNEYKNQQENKQNSNLQSKSKKIQADLEKMDQGQLQAIRILLNKNEELKKKTYEKLKIEHSEELLNKLTKKQATSLIKQLKEKVGD